MTRFESIFVSLLICVLSNGALAYFNLFISPKEVKKLMGLDMELYYVKEGIVNNYAVGYILTVNSSIEELEFTWQSLRRQPLQYNILIDYNMERGALQHPSLSIPSAGMLPFSTRTFKVFLHCNHNVTMEVFTEMHFNIKAPQGRNETSLTIKRNKICMQSSSEATRTILLKHKKDSGVFVAAMFAFFITSIVATAIGLSYVRNKKRFANVMRTTYSDTAYHGPHSVVIKLDPIGVVRPPSAASGSYATINSFNKYHFPDIRRTYNWFRVPSPYATTILHNEAPYLEPYDKAESIASSKISYYASSQVTQLCTLSTPSKSLHSKASAKKITDKLKDITVRENTVECDVLLQVGTYGRVYSGTLLEAGGKLRPVLVKTVVENATLTQVSFLLSDASLLCGVQHPNIMMPIAAFTELSGPPKVAYELPKENLKTYLVNYKEGMVQLNGISLHTRQLVDFALHITRGLLHLHNTNLLHGDIAARNCWLGAGLNICLGDSAVSRDIFPNEYYCLGDNQNRPIKWMSLEALERRQITSASDVWQLGVLFWELATLGMMPYEEVDAFELIPFLNDGFRLTQPKNCPDKFFKIMSCCWSADPDYRPTLIQMLTYLHELFDDLGKYI